MSSLPVRFWPTLNLVPSYDDLFNISLKKLNSRYNGYMLKGYVLMEEQEQKVKLRHVSTGDITWRYKAFCSSCGRDRGFKKKFKLNGKCKACAQHEDFVSNLDKTKYPNVSFGDKKLHKKPSKGSEMRYKTHCLECKKDRGYIALSNAGKLCRSCTRKLVHKNMAPEVKKKISEAVIKQFTGSTPWNKGQVGVYDDDLIKQWSDKHTDISADPEYRKKMSCSKRNIDISEFKEFSTTENTRERIKIRKSGLIADRLKLDDYICDLCYQRGLKLHAHHMYSFDKYPELRNNLYNLVTLCIDCHDKFHAEFGKGNNTKEQYLEFKDAQQLLAKKLVYILTGAPASGKTWVGSQVKNLTTLDSDIIPKKKLVDTVEATNKPLLILTVGVSTFMKRNPQYSYKLIVIQEGLATIQARMLARGGKITFTIERRIKRMESLAKQAAFSGTSAEVLVYLLKL